MIEIVLPGTGLGPRVLNTEQFGLIQELLTEAAVEAFAQPVLPGRARFDIKYRHANSRQPLLDRMGNELRTIVATNAFRNAVDREQFCKAVDRVFTLDAATNFDLQNKSRVLINDVQEANHTTINR